MRADDHKNHELQARGDALFGKRNAALHYGWRTFGKSGDAPPPITQQYTVEGWRPAAADSRLTRQTAEDLITTGVTMVRVRWKFRTHEILLRRYLGN